MSNTRIQKVFVVILITLTSCSSGPEPIGTSTPIPVADTNSSVATNTIAPTAFPTSLPPIISPQNVSNLTVYSVFGAGELHRSFEFSPDGTVLASAGGNTDDFSIRLWAVESGQLLFTLEGHTSIVWDIAFAPNGDLLSSASGDGTAKIWNWKSGDLVKTIDFTGQVVSVSFSPNGQTFAMGGGTVWPDASIWTYLVETWERKLDLTEFWNIPDIAFSSDGQFLVGGGTSRNVRVWTADTGVEQNILYHSGQVSSIAISPDASIVATGLCETSDDNAQCINGAVWLWDIQTGNLINQLSRFSDWVEDVAFSPDGSLLFAGSRDGSFVAFNTIDFEVMLSTSSPGAGGILAISPDGRLLATNGGNGIISVWRIAP